MALQDVLGDPVMAWRPQQHDAYTTDITQIVVLAVVAPLRPR